MLSDYSNGRISVIQPLSQFTTPPELMLLFSRTTSIIHFLSGLGLRLASSEITFRLFKMSGAIPEMTEMALTQAMYRCDSYMR